MSQTSSASADPTNEAADAAERLWRRWQAGETPVVDDFLKEAGPLSANATAAVLRVDQRERWRNGEHVLVETYLQKFPMIHEDREGLLDLIFNEFLLRERMGEGVSVPEFVQRFPQVVEPLQAQIQLHLAMMANTLMQSTHATHAATPERGPLPGADTLLPAHFGRYDILRCIGKGGMGNVYLAVDTQLEREVAVKVPRFSREDPRAIERFYREARTAATFTHPHLCPVYDVGQNDGIHFLTMPVIRGESLAAMLKREGRLAEATAIQLVMMIAKAMQVAHDAGVIHRDLKPANIIVNERGEPVIMDFGLARRTVPSDARLTDSGHVPGTPAFCAPEQIGGDPDALGPACDTYSLGVILYEMLTGRLPFHGPVHELLRKTLTEAPEPPSSVRVDLDPRLNAICLTALAKKPGDRFASMSTFAEALGEVLQSTNGSDSAQPLRRSNGGRRSWLVPTIVATLVVGLAAGGILWQWGPRGQSASTVPAADPLPLGSLWAGEFHFLPLGTYDGPLEVRITERNAVEFRGTYLSDTLHEWNIAGTLDGKRIRWGFTKAIRGDDAEALVGKGIVEGELNGDKMKLIFRDPNDRSSAEITLERKRD